MKKIFIFIFICLILYLLDQYLVKWIWEGFEVSGEVKPVLLFIYGLKNSKEKDQLKKIFKEDYKEYVGYIDVQEYDVKKKSTKELNEMKINPKMDYEIRLYQNGLGDKNTFSIYSGNLGGPLSDYVKQLETKQEDIVEGSGGGEDALKASAKDKKDKGEDED
jgi:hypothetical protein